MLPEGPGPTVYTVSYTNGVTSGTVPGCQRLASLTCTHAGVPYDGLTYTYTVVAANQPGDQPGKRSDPSAGTSIEAVGRPAAWGAFQVYADRQQPGGGGPATRCRTRAARPARSRSSWPGRSSAASPSRPARPPARHHARATSSPTGPAAGLQRGRPGGLHAERRAERPDLRPARRHARRHRSSRRSTASRSTWTVTGTSNGDPALLVEIRQRRAGAGVNLSVVGAFSQSVLLHHRRTSTRRPGIDVTVRDDSPGGRGSDYGVEPHDRGPAAARPRSASRAVRRCRTTRRPCRRAPAPRSRKCTADSCAYVVRASRIRHGHTLTNWTCDCDKF